VNKNKKLIATQVGQFPSTGEHYGLLLSKGDPVVGCVNTALNVMKTNGALAALQQKWLGIYTTVPDIQP
jgi:polar amino acid transport system substrate-binding protein